MNVQRGWRLALLVVLLLAAGLRFYRLGAQSFWNDEGNSARLVERSIPLIIEGAAGDIHPPGYYLLLHAWRSPTGDSEFALRSFSALCGVLTAALAAAVGWRAGGTVAAVGAGFFVAVNPLAVYYSQEARMYALLGLASTLTLWAGARLLDAPSWRRAALLAAAVTLGLYTQYAYVFALVGLNLASGLDWLLRRPWRWRAAGLWVGAHLLAGLAFAPWTPIALRASGWRPPDLGAAGAGAAMARTLLLGVTSPAGAVWRFALPAALLLGLALLTRARSRRVVWAAALMAFLPATLLLALGAYRPAYLKFLMVSVAPLGVLLALPLTLLARRGYRVAGGIAGACWLTLLPLQGVALQHLYFDPAYTRDDYRGIAARIAAEGRPGDAILLDAPNQWEVFTYYYKGPLPVYPAPYHPSPEAAAAWVADSIAGHRQLFVLYWGDAESDPGRAIELTLAQRAYKSGDEWLGAVRLARYGVAPLPEQPTASLAARLGEAVALDGVALPAAPLAPGDIAPVTLFWRALDAPDARFKVFVHLLDAHGQLAAQADAEPLGGFRPTDGWQPGETLLDRYGILLPPDLPVGTYTLVAGMYRFSGERLPVVADDAPAGDAVTLGVIDVRP